MYKHILHNHNHIRLCPAIIAGIKYKITNIKCYTRLIYYVCI